MDVASYAPLTQYGLVFRWPEPVNGDAASIVGGHAFRSFVQGPV